VPSPAVTSVAASLFDALPLLPQRSQSASSTASGGTGAGDTGATSLRPKVLQFRTVRDPTDTDAVCDDAQVVYCESILGGLMLACACVYVPARMYALICVRTSVCKSHFDACDGGVDGRILLLD